MLQVNAFFRLIRYRNLLVVFLTQWFTWRCVIVPMEAWSPHRLFLDAGNFLLLSSSTLLIAAAGYIINDYFDVRIDVINRPDKVIVERVIKRRWAMFWHTLFNAAGVGISIYLSWRLRNPWVLTVQALSTILLWFYSTHFKRQFVIGNLVVAVLTALSILILAVFEPALYPYFSPRYFLFVNGARLVNPVWVIGVYTYFAFMLTWMREIVKDMEDFKGDEKDGCITMPIKIGLRASTRTVIVLGILALVPLVVAGVKLITGSWDVLGIYLLVALAAPLVAWMIGLPRRTTTRHYAAFSLYLKLIMVLGIISLLLYFGYIR